MAYGRKYTPRKSPRSTPRTPRTPRATPRRNYRKKMPMVSFAKKVQAIISRNNENKFTSTLTFNNAVATFVNGAYSFFTWSPGQDLVNNRLFNLPVGTQEGQRIGNTIKLKRWIIKGLIQPKYQPLVGGTNGTQNNSYVGYVDIYFGKYLKNTAPVVNNLASLYENGASAVTPSCKAVDMLYPLNKDAYKVYFRRRFKMGAASDAFTNTGSIPSNTNPANNDFKVSQTFGFDVCKYILKDKHLKFNDGGVVAPYFPPENIDVSSLTVWATFTPLQGQSSNTSGSTGYSFWYIDCLTYAEYEDA